MIEQSVALEHIRSYLAAVTGRPIHLGQIPIGTDETSLPYAILYPLAVALQPARPLDTDPGPWRIELQCTAVGRVARDAAALIARIDTALQDIGPPAGYSDIMVDATVGPLTAPSETVFSIVQRWAVSV